MFPQGHLFRLTMFTDFYPFARFGSCVLDRLSLFALPSGCGSKIGTQNRLPWQMETWTKTCRPIPGGFMLSHPHFTFLQKGTPIQAEITDRNNSLESFQAMESAGHCYWWVGWGLASQFPVSHKRNQQQILGDMGATQIQGRVILSIREGSIAKEITCMVKASDWKAKGCKRAATMSHMRNQQHMLHS